MLTLLSKETASFNPIKYLINGVCLSSDTKPNTNDIMNGSMLMEIDTATLYIYDETNKFWRAWQ